MLEIAFALYTFGLVFFLIGLVGAIVATIFKKKDYIRMFLYILIASILVVAVGIIMALKTRGII